MRMGKLIGATEASRVYEAWLADGTEAVLKRGPVSDETRSEMLALGRYQGDGAVRLLGADAEAGELVLERVRPGTQLAALGDDDEATRVLADVMRRLWRPLEEGHPFRSVASLADGFGRAVRMPQIPPLLRERAAETFEELCATSSRTVLLHGDLHHFNVLRDGEGWIAIDPKGWAGDPAYDTGPLLRNPIPRDVRPLLERRIGLLSEALQIEAGRIRAWAFAQAVLSAIWTVEDGGTDWDAALGIGSALLDGEDCPILSR